MHSIKNKNISCPICGKRPIGQMNTLEDYWYCNNCSLGWIKEIPKITYKESYYTSGSSILAKLFVPLQICFYKIRELYSGYKQKDIYIDVGAGDGKFLSNINAKRKIGVEISQSGRKIMEKNGLQTLSPKAFLQLKNKKADVISFWHVLEHVDHPIAYIKAAKNNINKTGKIIIAVPNVDGFEFRIFKRYWFHLTPQFHVWFFTPLALKKILKLNDLKIESIDYWAIEHHFAGTLQSFINFTTHTDNTLHKLIKRKQDLSSLSFVTIFWIIFWCTVGLHFIFCFWIIASLSKQSGAIVVIASRK